MTKTQHIPVSALLAQSECIIHSLGSDDKTAQRLAHMGILPGTHLHIIRVAPLGGTIEVNDGQGQNFALRQQEVTAMTCEPVAMPLISELIAEGQTYMIRDLRGGKTFQQRMAAAGLQEGGLIQIRESGIKPIQAHLVDTDKQISLGEGEAKKIIIEVINHE
ncbi:MAG: FeoA domain-containing protein [Pseudomonadota bacterium]|nr:FeoA domain-containing protein [Pseudomonadota bacterium]